MSFIWAPDLLVNKLVVFFSTDAPIRPSLTTDLRGTIHDAEGKEMTHNV